MISAFSWHIPQNPGLWQRISAASPDNDLAKLLLFYQIVLYVTIYMIFVSPMSVFLAASRPRLGQKSRSWHSIQTINSTHFVVSVSALWYLGMNISTPARAPYSEISIVKCGFSYRPPVSCSHSSTKAVHWIGNIGLRACESNGKSQFV